MSAAQALALFQKLPLNLLDIQSDTQILLCRISRTSLSDYWRITLQRCVIILFLGPIKFSRLAVHKIQKPKSAGHQKHIIMLNNDGRSWAGMRILRHLPRALRTQNTLCLHSENMFWINKNKNYATVCIDLLLKWW